MSRIFFYAAIAVGRILTSSKIFVQTSSLWQLENSSQGDLQRWRNVQCCLQVSRQCRGSLGHLGILPWCPLRHRPPCCLDDLLDILGSSLTHRLPCCLGDPLDILGSSLGVPSHTGPHAVRRIPWTSRDPSLVSPHTQAPMLSEDPLDIPESLGVPSDTDPHAVHTQPPNPFRRNIYPRILPWCPSNTGPQRCPEVPLDIPGSSLGVPSNTGPHPIRRIPWTSRDPPFLSPQT